MAGDFYSDAAANRAARLAADRAEELASLARARANGDLETAGYCVQQLANIEAQRRSLESLHQDYVRSQNPPAPPQPTPEERAARQWQHMTPDDALDLARTS